MIEHFGTKIQLRSLALEVKMEKISTATMTLPLVLVVDWEKGDPDTAEPTC